MADVSQGQVYRCDFGAEGGIELAGPRLALVVSEDAYNAGSSSVLVVPTTRGGFDPLYVDYYPPLERFGTRASCRNIRAIRADRLRRLKGSVKRPRWLRWFEAGSCHICGTRCATHLLSAGSFRPVLCTTVSSRTIGERLRRPGFWCWPATR